jgi:hypothetical protein
MGETTAFKAAYVAAKRLQIHHKSSHGAMVLAPVWQSG